MTCIWDNNVVSKVHSAGKKKKKSKMDVPDLEKGRFFSGEMRKYFIFLLAFLLWHRCTAEADDVPFSSGANITL